MKKRKIISFKVSKADAALIAIAAHRATLLCGETYWPLQDATMDLTACHANGCRLDLPLLLSMGDASFIHDVGGIKNHLDRDDASPTGGQLLRCFLPRSHWVAPTLANIGGYKPKALIRQGTK